MLHCIILRVYNVTRCTLRSRDADRDGVSESIKLKKELKLLCFCLKCYKKNMHFTFRFETRAIVIMIL